MSRKSDRFEDYLKRRLKKPTFRRHFEQARVAMGLAHDIVLLREKLGLKQADLARRMGTSQQAVSRLERGDYEGFTLRTLQAIAKATATQLVIGFRPLPRRKAN